MAVEGGAGEQVVLSEGPPRAADATGGVAPLAWTRGGWTRKPTGRTSAVGSSCAFGRGMQMRFRSNEVGSMQHVARRVAVLKHTFSFGTCHDSRKVGERFGDSGRSLPVGPILTRGSRVRVFPAAFVSPLMG